MRAIAAAVLLVVAATACSDAASPPVVTSKSSTVGSTATTTALATTSSPSMSPTTEAPTTAASTTEASTTEAPTTSAVIPQGFQRVAATAVTLEGEVCELCLWLADNDDLRALGLMYATELGAADGMLFQYPGATSGAFWMKNTLMPLSIAFYDASGAYLDSFDMEPCVADPCPTYPTPNDFVYAIETTQGGLTELGLTQGSLLTVTDLPCE